MAAREPEQSKYDARITIRLSSDDKADLVAFAQRRRRGHNWLARDILEKWLAKERRRNPLRK